MRGKVEDIREHFEKPGITPAHAGKSVKSDFQSTATGDHPRACGEKKEQLKNQDAQLGSPPRMRGKGVLQNISLQLLGITPAHAGKSIPNAARMLSGRDHPRACGEKGYVTKKFDDETGSPPRMRGKD